MSDYVTGRGWLARDPDSEPPAWSGEITIAGYRHFLRGHVETRDDGRLVLALRTVEPEKEAGA